MTSDAGFRRNQKIHLMSSETSGTLPTSRMVFDRPYRAYACHAIIIKDG